MTRSVWRVLADDLHDFIGGTFALMATISVIVGTLWLCIEHPLIGLPLVATVLLLIWIASACERAK